MLRGRENVFDMRRVDFRKNVFFVALHEATSSINDTLLLRIDVKRWSLLLRGTIVKREREVVRLLCAECMNGLKYWVDTL